MANQMKSVGLFLSSARQKNHYSLYRLSQLTKIKPEYLRHLEQNNFSKLPQATFVKGFIRSYARAVDLDENHALAIFRRDFDQDSRGRVVPRTVTKPLKSKLPLWSPKNTTLIASLVLGLVVLAYIANQLLNLTKPPTISIDSPTTDTLSSSLVEITGRTSPDATLTVNDQPVSLGLDGKFSTILELEPGTHTINFQATARDGRSTTQTKTVTINPQQN